MNEHTNTFSVVIPTHNRLKDLQQALTSVFSQTVKPLEIIVVDDGSTPKVSDDIFATAPDETKTLLLRNESPKGAPHARNRGIEAANGSWIAFLDDDDEFKPNKIEQITNHIQQNPKCDLIYHPADIHMVNEGITYTSRPRQFTPEDDIFKNMLIKNEIGGTSMVVVKKEILIKAGKFQESMPALQDYELWLRVVNVTPNICFISPSLTNYYNKTQTKSISKNIESKHQATLFIEKLYRNDYLSLNKKDKKRYKQRKHFSLIYRYLLCKNTYKFLKFYLLYFIKYPSIKNFFILLAFLLNPNILFKIKKILK
jgi:glycosyltransferase involved in cell wall biosynthesis